MKTLVLGMGFLVVACSRSDVEGGGAVTNDAGSVATDSGSGSLFDATGALDAGSPPGLDAAEPWDGGSNDGADAAPGADAGLATQDGGCVADCPGCVFPDGGVGPGGLCAIHASVVACCASGDVCPVSLNRYMTGCCAEANIACALDSDCCSGACANGACLQGGAHTACGLDADCEAGSCNGSGLCTPIGAGQACTASNECDFGLFCSGGVCICLGAGTVTTPANSGLCCDGWSWNGQPNSGQCDCSSTGWLCMSNADCCGGGSGLCVNYHCT